jgi:hypothetical protein
MQTIKPNIEKIAKTVINSQKIEGYPITQNAEIKERAKQLMEKYHVQILPRK